MYSKPHLSYELQLARLKDRGLVCADDLDAVRLLKAVGYYRLSAYVYPFRIMLPAGAARTSPVHYRADRIREGVTIEQVEALWLFDRKLRLTCLDAVETIEIGMRTRLAHVLGRRDPFGHLTRSALDTRRCAEHLRGTGRDAFDDWHQRYQHLLDAAGREDYVVHHHAKHADDPRLPIWIAVEFFDLGSLARLFKLLEKRDQNEIAEAVGVAGGPLLGAWLRDINYLRNACAHHSRLWNRTLTYKPKKFNPTQVGGPLRHVAQMEPREKIYVLLAIVAYLVTNVDPARRWPESGLRTLVRKFPADSGLSPEGDMGFPEGWAELPLWRHTT